MVLAGQFDGANGLDGDFVAAATSRQEDFEERGFVPLRTRELAIVHISDHTLTILQRDRHMAAIIESGFDLAFQVVARALHNYPAQTLSQREKSPPPRPRLRAAQTRVKFIP
jgi:hypothetical protein